MLNALEDIKWKGKSNPFLQVVSIYLGKSLTYIWKI